jgi:hypothetical protein
MTRIDIHDYTTKTFGCDLPMFIEALENSPNSRGYILGALSELILWHYLDAKGYEVLRIVEKPSGGYDAKSNEARGDFYVRGKGSKADAWLVLESKGLKSNSEFRGAKFNNRQKVFRYLRPLAFPAKDTREVIYAKGLHTYQQAKARWEQANPRKNFPPFGWSRHNPGPITCNLSGIWKNEDDLQMYLDSLPDEAFTEEAYRECRGALAVLETHKPNRRKAPVTGVKQAAPLVSDFSVLAVDLYLRTGKHEFAFVNPETLSHSPTSPEHLYQNYTIDILVPPLKTRPRFILPWYGDFDECVAKTQPAPRKLDPTQINHRQD